MSLLIHAYASVEYVFCDVEWNSIAIPWRIQAVVLKKWESVLLDWSALKNRTYQVSLGLWLAYNYVEDKHCEDIESNVKDT